MHIYPLCVHTEDSFLQKSLRNWKKMSYFATDFRNDYRKKIEY